jgi:NAD(P)-dependent dehydrogenase (short-subunit alcohol dehydrogenase family)
MLAARRAVITGAVSGMGRAAALRFTAEGARVGLIDLDEVAASAWWGLDVVAPNAGVQLAG